MNKIRQRGLVWIPFLIVLAGLAAAVYAGSSGGPGQWPH